MSNNNLISQSEAARIAGVSRQGICNLKKSGNYSFFSGGKVDIDSDSWKSYIHERESMTGEKVASTKIKPDNVPPADNNNAVNKNKPVKRIQGQQQSDRDYVLNNIVPEEREVMEKVMDKIPHLAKGFADAVKKIKNENNKSSNKNKLTDEEIKYYDEKQEHALTGGFNPIKFTPQNLADIERLAKIQNLNIQMRVRLGELIEKDLVETVIDIFQQNIQSHFVDLPRRVSGLICKKLDRVGAEKEIEKILTGPIAKGISEIKKISINSAELKRLSDEAFRDGQNELQAPEK